jgi:hypothetical protein
LQKLICCTSLVQSALSLELHDVNIVPSHAVCYADMRPVDFDLSLVALSGLWCIPLLTSRTQPSLSIYSTLHILLDIWVPHPNELRQRDPLAALMNSTSLTHMTCTAVCASLGRAVIVSPPWGLVQKGVLPLVMRTPLSCCRSEKMVLACLFACSCG